jgi:hypothetical protein
MTTNKQKLTKITEMFLAVAQGNLGVFAPMARGMLQNGLNSISETQAAMAVMKLKEILNS